MGLKRSGIISLSGRLIIEIIGNERMDVPVAKDNKILINKEYLTTLVKEANKKMEKNLQNIKKFYKIIK